MASVMRSLWTSATALVAMVCWTAAAQAQTDYCSYLRAQLAQTKGGGGNTQALYQELAIASAQANNLNCRRGFFLFGGAGAPQCPAILARIDQLQGAISQSRGGGFFGYNQADSIRSQMARAGCGEDTGPSYGGGTRTVCVRVCDGYYFPISNSGGRERVKQDEKTCDSLYPDGQAQIFIDDGGDGDINVERMVTPQGKRYRDQPYALAYRSSFNAACPTPRATSASASASAGTAAGTLVPIPVAKPRAGEDPETLANREGGFTLQRIAPTVAATAEGADAAKREIRVVGPSYYYAITDAPASGTQPPGGRQASDGTGEPAATASTVRVGAPPSVQ